MESDAPETILMSKKINRSILIFLIIILALPSIFLLFMRYVVVANEGYPSWEAVRNMLDRDGEIVITIPKGAKIISANCDKASATVSINKQVVTTKIGYAWCLISIKLEIKGKIHVLTFHPQKLNHWNRIRYEPINSTNPHSDFRKFENGIEKSPHIAHEIL